MSRPVLRFAATRCAPALASLVRLWSRTWQLELRGAEQLVEARRGGGVIFCFLHGRMLELVLAHAGLGIGVLISPHADGRLAERLVGRLGYAPIRGSRREGAFRGTRGLLRHAAGGGDLALAADAEAGRVPPGASRLARISGHAIVPVAAAARPRRCVESWDRFEIPAPGARVLIGYGTPIRLARDADRTAERTARATLERALVNLHEALERELDAGLSPDPARGVARRPVAPAERRA